MPQLIINVSDEVMKEISAVGDPAEVIRGSLETTLIALTYVREGKTLVWIDYKGGDEIVEVLIPFLESHKL